MQQQPALKNSECFRYDLMDVSRQLMADYCLQQLHNCKQSFVDGDVQAYDQQQAKFVQALQELDELLASHPQTLLGVWTSRAEAKGNNAADKAAMLQAAKLMVTGWSCRTSTLNDYSNRHWAGLVKDYYLPRWLIFFQQQRDVLLGKANPTQAAEACRQKLEALTRAFYTSPHKYANTPTGDCCAIAARLILKYAKK